MSFLSGRKAEAAMILPESSVSLYSISSDHTILWVDQLSRNGLELELSGACAFRDNELNTTLSAYYIIFNGTLERLHSASVVYFDVSRREQQSYLSSNTRHALHGLHYIFLSIMQFHMFWEHSLYEVTMAVDNRKRI